MPRYEYHCQDCDEVWEQTEHIADHEKVAQRDASSLACPRCSSHRVEPVLSAFFARTARKS